MITGTKIDNILDIIKKKSIKNEDNRQVLTIH